MEIKHGQILEYILHFKYTRYKWVLTISFTRLNAVLINLSLSETDITN